MNAFCKTLVLMCFSPLVNAQVPCADLISGYRAPIRCSGTAVDQTSGRPVEFKIDLNAAYATEAAGSMSYVYNLHRVEMTRPFWRMFTRTSSASFVHFYPDCVREGALVRCSGREDDRQFDLTIDLEAGTATGTYRDTRYFNPWYQNTFTFEAANALVCR